MSTTRDGAQSVGEHAVVIGASIAGLLAARVLSDAYERVTIVERDELPAVGQGRKAVPQGSHAHVMLASGQRAVESLLPGITEELLAAGARTGKALREIRLVVAGHPITREAHAALEAIELRRCLKRGEHRLAQRFFQAAGKHVDQAWDLAVGGDLALPEIAGHRPRIVRITNAYVERLLRVAEHDAIVAQAFGDVSDLLAPPQEILRPRILWRVLRGNLRRRPVLYASRS